MKLIQADFSQNKNTITQANSAINVEAYVRHSIICKLVQEITDNGLIAINRVDDSINYNYSAHFMVASEEEINDLRNLIKRYEPSLPPLLFAQLLKMLQ